MCKLSRFGCIFLEFQVQIIRIHSHCLKECQFPYPFHHCALPAPPPTPLTAPNEASARIRSLRRQWRQLCRNCWPQFLHRSCRHPPIQRLLNKLPLRSKVLHSQQKPSVGHQWILRRQRAFRQGDLQQNPSVQMEPRA